MITKQELVDGIRFAGSRAAAAARNTKDWDHQLAHKWTTRDAFSHVAATAGGLPGLYPMLDGGTLSGVGIDQVAQINDRRIGELANKSPEDIAQAIVDGHNASAEFVAGLDEDELAKIVQLGGYEMPKAELLAQIWINHALAHSYEASARWPLA
jgi:hypothetical protein